MHEKNIIFGILQAMLLKMVMGLGIIVDNWVKCDEIKETTKCILTKNCSNNKYSKNFQKKEDL